MLTINSHQMETFNQSQEQQFCEQLREYIQQEYPAYAKVSPVVMTRLVELALQRARSYGFTWQSTLSHFVSLMAAIAPNFDLHPAIHTGLVNSEITLEERIEILTENLPSGVWDEAIRDASTMGWFMTRDSFGIDPVTRIADALSNAMPDHSAKCANITSLVKRSIIGAESIGFSLEDQQFFFAAATLLYGENFISQTSLYPWIKDVFDQQSAVKTQSALLRMRIALDHQVWV